MDWFLKSAILGIFAYLLMQFMKRLVMIPIYTWAALVTFVSLGSWLSFRYLKRH